MGALHARKFKGLGPKLIIFSCPSAATARAMGTNSWIMSAQSPASPTGYSGI